MSNFLRPATDTARVKRIMASVGHGLLVVGWLCCLWTTRSTVRAQQTQSAMVLPWYDDELDPRPPEAYRGALEHASAELQRAGYEVVDATVLRMRLLAYGRFPAEISAEDRTTFKRLAREALVAVGRIQPGGADPKQGGVARAAIARVMGFAKDHLETLHRESDLAEQVIDACLLTPRVMVAEGASEQLVVLEALECRRLTPGVSPTVTAHPPEVLASLAKADEIILSLPPGQLLVETTDACTECRVFLNGRPLGVASGERALLPGSYRAQVEYPGQPPATAFVHEITLAPSHTTELQVSPFEAALRANERGLYVAKSDGVANSDATLGELLRQVGVDRLLLVRNPRGDHYAYRMVDAGREVASCEAESEGPSDAAVQALLHCADHHRNIVSDRHLRPPAASPAAHAPAQVYASTRSPAVRSWGLALGAAGGAGLLGAWIADLATRGPDRSNALGHGLQGLAGTGAVLIAASEPLWLPIGRKHPAWWAWTGMALGGVPVVVGALAWSNDRACAHAVLHPTGAECRDVYRTRVTATTAFAASLPLLALPVSHYLARAWWGTRHERVSLAINMHYNAGAPGLTLRGSF